MADAVYRQVKVLVVGRQAAEAGRRHRHAVVGALARQDLLLAGLADGVVVVPDHLHRAVVGFRARVGEEHPGHGHRCQGQQLLGQLRHRRVGAVVEGVVVGQGLQGLGACRDQAGVAEAQRAAPQARHALDVAAPLLVFDMDAVAARDHQRADVGVGGQVGEGVQVGRDVLGGQLAGGVHVGAFVGAGRYVGKKLWWAQ